MKRMTVKILMASIAVAFAAVTPAFATIEWQWQFNTAANPASANVGDPAATANIHVGAFGQGWHTDWNLGSATGYWDLGKNGTVQLTIPNLATPTRSYNATLSIVQWIDNPIYTGVLSYSVPGATLLASSSHLIQATGHGSWVEYDTIWNLLPSSNPEIITITAPSRGAIFDRITVVPEPTTLIAGALFLVPFGVSTLRLRRRNKKG
jgi:hypothetical protein